MIKPFNSRFFTPTKMLRRLNVLLAIYNDSKSSQHKIGKITHLSSSMVNNYIKEFLDKKLITIKGKTNRTQSYHLTTLGQKELMSLLLDYSAEIIQLYSSSKYEVAEKLNSLQEEGIKEVALFGAAETAEVVHVAIKDSSLIVKAIVDSDPKKHGTPFNGLKIQSPEILKKIKVDAIVITSFGKQEEIYQMIRKMFGDKIKVKKLSDL